MIKPKQAVVVVAIGMWGAACTPEPWDFETDSLRINLADEFSGTLCQGDLEALESHVGRTAAFLEVDVETKVDVSLWPGFENPGDACQTDGASGCHRAGVVQATNLSLFHELVHAVAWQAGDASADRFLEEGMAEALSGRAIRAPTVFHPFDELTGRGDPASREVGAHFVRWAIDRYGAEGLLNARGLDATAGFVAWTGTPLDVAEQEYLASAVFAYPSVWGCDATVELEDGVAELAFDLSCDNDETRAYGSSTLERCETVRLDDAGVYELQATAARLSVSRCLTEPETEPVDTTISPTVPTDYHFQGAFPVLPGSTAFLELQPGAYELCLTSDSLEDLTAFGRIEWTGYESLP